MLKTTYVPAALSLTTSSYRVCSTREDNVDDDTKFLRSEVDEVD